MASTVDFAEFVCEQIKGAGSVRYRKMFGEYMIYVNDKPILLLCDNTVYIKQLGCIADKMTDAGTGFPYSGAKEHYILDIEDRDFSLMIIRLLESVTAVPKPKRKKPLAAEQKL